jgi:hypothetical protein
MKKTTLLNSALIILLSSAIIFSCKKKDDTAPDDTNSTTTGGTTGGGTTGGTPTPSVNFVSIAGGSTYNIDSIQVGGYTAVTQTYRQKGTIKNNVNFGLVLDLYGYLAPTAGTYIMKSTGTANNDAYVSLTLPNGSGGNLAYTAISGTITSTLNGGKLISSFNNAVFQSSFGWPITTYTVSGSITNP